MKLGRAKLYLAPQLVSRRGIFAQPELAASSAVSTPLNLYLCFEIMKF